MSHPLLEQLDERTLTVAEYLELINGLITPIRVSVEGEVTDLKVLPQWTFFALKDAETGALLRCGLHSGVYRRIGVNLEEGMAVKVEGYGKIAEKSGNFGFWVSRIEPIGEGALRRAYELLLKKLQEEGLFTRKRELPQFISHIGVISSKNGVVLQDLRKNLRPLGIRIDFVHSGVEGADSAKEILRSIEFFSKPKNMPEVLVLIRGGGSLESLQGFNNEAVVRALYASPVPVLVGIGHDVDAPIATLVADWSASTPTAVAHVINDSWRPITERMPRLAQTIAHRFTRGLSDIQHKADASLRAMRHACTQVVARFHAYEATLTHALRRVPSRLMQTLKTAEVLESTMRTYISRRIETLKARIESSERLLTASDPERVLARGYGLVYNPEGRLVRRVEDVNEGDTLTTRLAKGTVWSAVTKKEA
jgi:exodeoxyribonuclease VII large subunit